MDAAHRRPQLPALSYLDIDKVKREEEAYPSRTTAQSLPSSAAPSPTFQYPSGPPPPYSHSYTAPQSAQPASTWSGAQSDAQTPPDSRRPSGDEKDVYKPSARQSLPSISEALGGDTQAQFASKPAPPPPSLPTSLRPQQASVAPTSPSPTIRRSYPMEPPQAPPSTFAAPSQSHSYSQFRPDSAHPPLYPPIQDSKPSLQLQTPAAPPASSHFSYTKPVETSPTHDLPASRAGASMPPSSFPYGYTSYTPRYTTPPSSASNGPIYQPSSMYGPPQSQSSGWRPEASRFNDRNTAPVGHGESVKRHLEFFDLEQALTEISQKSSMLTDFSRRYGDRMHQNQRSGITPSTLPSIVEVDDMMHKSRVLQDALAKIRDVVVTQQAAYEQQVAEQRQAPKSFVEPMTPQSNLHSEIDDRKGSYTGTDTKKRRGRAAPPGRCHSCNRADTPEWRRGPDGARTLCNACGLHFAKLTRKSNIANKSTTAGSSNLRPKEP